MNWEDFLKVEKEKDYFKKIEERLESDYKKWLTIYPKKQDIYNALNLTKFDDIKVVILWQDPYHWEWQAHWLAFSVQKWVKQPPSLKNIFKEIESSLKIKTPEHWDLSSWAKQWVLLLNTALTVIEWKPASHGKIWWEIFTDNIIKEISEKKENVVFMLWWTHAQSKEKLINKEKHKIIKESHPSPLSAYRWFLWSDCFVNVNQYLKEKNLSPINWA